MVAAEEGRGGEGVVVGEAGERGDRFLVWLFGAYAAATKIMQCHAPKIYLSHADGFRKRERGCGKGCSQGAVAVCAL